MIRGVLILLTFGLTTWAQVEQGVILGSVSDPAGARVPNAQVTFTNLATNVSQAARTDGVGNFRSIPLRTGPYSVTIEAAGFKKIVRTGITLQIQDELRLDVVLEVGQTTEQVTVTADATLLQTTEASRGQVIDNKKIVDLPLNGRDYLQLALLTAGTNVPPPGARFGGFSSSGFRVSHNNYLLDGMDNNSNQHAAQGRTPQVIAPSVDAVQEFKVQTSNYSAEFGRNVGGAVNVVIKSGTNDFRGGVFEFLRNEDFNARNFFQAPGVPNAVFRRNQFGGLLGGPIVRNKTFFFANYEGTIERQADTSFRTVATEAERRGDFSRGFFNNVPTQIFDPATYNATTRARQPFPGNIIPAGRIDPVAAKVAGYSPNPNQSTIINNYFSNPKTVSDTHKGDVRIDHTFGSKDTIYGRYSYQNFFNQQEGALPGLAVGGSDTTSTNENRPQSFVISHGHIFSPNIFNTFKVGWNRLLTKRGSPLDKPYNQEIGLKGTATNLNGYALFNINGFTALGPPANNPQYSDSQTRQLSNDLLWTKGRHTIKTGMNLMFIQSPHEQAFQSNGTFTFNGNFTRQSSNNTFGNPFADFLLGIPFNSQLATYAQGNQRRRIHAGYLQDDIKVSQRLMVNLGVRWEYIGPWFEKYNKYSNFDIDESYSNPQLRLAKDGGIADRSTVRPDWNNWAPRVGIAYRFDEKTVLRTGYGIYYGGVDHIGDRFLHCSPPFFFQFGFNTDSINPTIILRDGFPIGSTTSNITNLQTISQDRTNRSPYAQQWNFTIQRELSANWSLEAGYVGTKGNRLLQRYDSNAPDPGPGNINTRRPVTRVDVPGVGIVTPLADTFRREFSANSNYHAAQLRAEKRMANGLSLLGSYVFSKTISDARGGADAGGTANNAVQDRMNFQAERSLADEHFAHRFVVSSNWDIPVGKGRAFLSGMPGWANAVIGGWAVGGILTMTSGRRVNITVNGDPANVGNGTAPRPNATGQVPDLPSDERTLSRWFNTGAFARQANFTFGNSPRNPVTAPSLKNLDLAMYKVFQFTETKNLQLRGEFFNATNTPFFGAPGNTLGLANFGLINNAADARIIQIAAKFYF